MAKRKHFMLASILAIATTPALSQDVDRYQLERNEDGYVRLDTTTGRMSICQETNGQLVCRAAVEEREAYERDIGTLQQEMDQLEARVAALEAARGTDLPSEEEFQQGLGYMEQFFRRFMGVVRDFEDDPAPVPDRT